MRIILASGSPRRKQLLREIAADFEIIVSDVDEDALLRRDPQETVERLAHAKASAVFANHSDALVIGGDTVVVIDGDILNKPQTPDDAAAMLRRLAGRTHEVRTGVCILAPNCHHVFSEVTQVTFRALADDEIDSYVATGEPMDKAGAYAIQGGAEPFVERFVGSLTNVIGLPMERLQAILQQEFPAHAFRENPPRHRR